MSDATIELLKGYEPKKMEWPAYMSEKLDGVPVRMVMLHNTEEDEPYVQPLTRQGERILSIEHLLHAAYPLLPETGSSFVGELYIDGVPFKDISGLVRQHEQAPELRLHVFDAELSPDKGMSYAERMAEFGIRLRANPTDLIKLIPYTTVVDAAAAERESDAFLYGNPKAEGVVLHSIHKKFQPGKRCWGTQRIKPQPTLDLRVESFEEAIDKYGEPKGMVGRINVHYERQYEGDPHPVHSVIGIGPGALSHNQRIDLWNTQTAAKLLAIPQIVEVKFMPDPTYEALRQPTFVRFRPDKDTGDVHHV